MLLRFIFVLCLIMSITPANAGEIHDAVIKGRLADVESLISSNPDLLDVRDKSGLTPAFIALDRGRVEIARYLISQGTDIGIRGYRNRTLLHMAARSGHAELVQLLLDRGANIAARDSDGFTPVNLAHESGHNDVVQIFVSCGVDSADVVRPRPPKPAPLRYTNGKSAREIPFTFDNQAIILPLRLNDSLECAVALDTGMPVNGLLLFWRDSLHKPDLQYVGRKPIYGVGSDRPDTADIATGVKLSVPGVEFLDQRVEVFLSKRTAGWADDGVIGNTFLASGVVEVDFEQHLINHLDPSAFSDADAGEPLEIQFSTGQPYIEVTVSVDGGEEIPLLLALDSGMPYSLSLFADEQAKIGLPQDTVRALLGTGLCGDIFGRIGRLSSLKIGSHTLHDVLARFPDQRLPFRTPKGKPLDGILGIEILRRFTTVFDYSRARMYVKPNKYFPEPFEFSMAGLLLRRKADGQRQVSDVIHNSPAARAGIEKGDIIIAVNGRETREYGNKELRNLFRQEDATVNVTIEREAGQFSRTLVLKRII